MIATAKLLKVSHSWTSTVRQRPNGTYYISVPKNDMRAFIRKLPMTAHAIDPATDKSYIIVAIVATWEGLMFDD